MQYIGIIIGMVACIIFSAYFSATETAFSSLSRTRIKTLAEKGNKRAKLVLKLSQNYDRLLSTLLIGNNLVNIGVASLGTVLFVSVLGDIGATVSTVVITIVVLIFGEVSPKSIAKDFPESFAMFSAPLLQLLIWVFAPLNLLFSLLKKFISLFFKKKASNKMSQAELLMFVEEVEEGGSIDTSEGDLLRNAIEFSEVKAEQILTHRVDLESLSLDMPKKDIAEKFEKTKFTRLLVYNEDIDNIIGVLHMKDFFTAKGITDKSIKDIITPPIFTHSSEKISELLKRLQTNKSHVAVVLDEYGGTLGIVTMEDILEELVGEIWDEHDDVQEDVKQIDETNYTVNCGMNFNDFSDKFDIDVQSESSTVNGWISEQLDKVPVKDDTFNFKNLTVTVTEADNHKALFAHVLVNPITEEEEDKKDKKDKDDKDDKEHIDEKQEKSDKPDPSDEQ